MAESDWVPRPYRVVAASTRPVRVKGLDYMVRFSREALDGLAAQMRERFVATSLEHLTYLPPIGRWVDGTVEEAKDGEFELVIEGRELRQLVRRGEDPQVFDIVEQLPEVPASMRDLDLRIRFESRNFEPDVAKRLAEDCPVPTEEELRWAALPPIEWVLLIPVVWGAARFAGAFFDELGRSTASALVDWIRTASAAAREPERDRMVTVDFDLGEGKVIHAVVPVRADESDDVALFAALDSVGDIASIAGMQKDNSSAPFPGMQQAAFVFDGETWRLAWWTDGESVYRSRWFDENAPDPARFLGHPLLSSSDAPSVGN